MTAQLKTFRTVGEIRIDGARKVLDDAIGQKFNDVIVFGFKDGKIWVKGSGSQDRLRLIGALEVAKMKAWGVEDDGT